MANVTKGNYVLAGVGGLLLIAASFTRALPIAIFVAFAPLFALVDRRSNGFDAVVGAWIAIFLGAAAWHQFQSGTSTGLVLQGVMVALVLAAFHFARRPLGERFGVLSLILFWMAGEYLVLKLIPSKPYFFLADAVYEKTDWLRWSTATGYLGASCWILLANMFFYFTFLRKGFQPRYLVFLLIVILAPILYSYISSSSYLPRLDMILLYMDDSSANGSEYAASGEWIARTAAWTSVLVLLSAVVKRNTKKS